MIVPAHWAEARRQHRAKGKQVTIRRYGWSDLSHADALAMAQTRADDALQRALSGEKLERREPKVAYNGAQGTPIREEILQRHGEQIITRNGYGARCLNSPNALFADVDFEDESILGPTLLVFFVLAAAAVLVGMLSRSLLLGIALALISAVAAYPLTLLARRINTAAQGGADRLARKRLESFLAANPSWAVRLYRTPAGLRILATHQPFDANADEVKRFFSAVRADPMYVRMSANQHCFRARLSAKPWRIGIAAHMRPRPGVWPVDPERIDMRNAWVAEYEAKAAEFAACRYLESLGSGQIHIALREVIDLHDSQSRALDEAAKLA